MDKDKINYVSRVGNNIPKDVKEYVLKRVKEGGKTRAGDLVFNLKAMSDATTTISSFSSSLTVTLSYEDSDVEGLEESSLLIYRYDGSSWNALSGCSVDVSLNSISCTTSSFSDFAIFGDDVEEESISQTTINGTPIHRRIQNLIAIGNNELALELSKKLEVEQNVSIEIDAKIDNKVKNEGSNVSYNRDLDLGYEGDDVKKLQEFLIESKKGPSASELQRVGVTGYFGRYTKNALGEFQLSVGITPHAGYFGEKTRAYLNNR